MNQQRSETSSAVGAVLGRQNGLGQPLPEWRRLYRRRWCNRIWDVVERQDRLRKEPERI